MVITVSFSFDCQGLFHKGISESGTAIKIWTLSKFPSEQAKKFASKMSCPTESTKDMVDCLKKLDAHQLVKPHIETMVWNFL
jgi:carboxylesterase type B